MMPPYVSYLIFALVIGFFARKWMMFRSVQRKLPELIKEGALIIDVRSSAEFASGHVEGSLNIPLQQLANRTRDLETGKTVLLCCASGTRSGMAVAILKGKGFKKVINAGSWSNLASIRR